MPFSRCAKPAPAKSASLRPCGNIAFLTLKFYPSVLNASFFPHFSFSREPVYDGPLQLAATRAAARRFPSSCFPPEFFVFRPQRDTLRTNITWNANRNTLARTNPPGAFSLRVFPCVGDLPVSTMPWGYYSISVFSYPIPNQDIEKPWVKLSSPLVLMSPPIILPS